MTVGDGPRTSDRPPGPARLVVYPQRSGTSWAFVFGGLFLMGSPLWSWLAAHHDQPRWPTPMDITFGASFGLCTSVLPALGLYGLFRRVTFDVDSEGMLTLTWIEWPRPRRTRTCSVGDVKQVVVEAGDGTARIVLILPEEVVPLTGSSTSDDPSRTVVALNRFFGHDETVVVVEEARIETEPASTNRR